MLFISISIIIKEPLPLILVGSALVGLIIIRHGENIKRLITGSEKLALITAEEGIENVSYQS